jgi:hypothetical protein
VSAVSSLQRQSTVDPELVARALEEHRAAALCDLPETEVLLELRESVRLKRRRAWWLVTCEAAAHVGIATAGLALAALAVVGLLKLVG